MGENAEIFARLRDVETSLAEIKERLRWLERLAWLMFGGGGVVGWALAKVFG